MNQHLFQVVPLIERSFMQKLFRQHVQENAVIELNNLFAQKEILEITARDIQDIESQYQLSLAQEFPLNLEEFYAVYLNHCLKDHSLSDEELENLRYLKQLLLLSDNSIEILHIRIGQAIFKQSFEAAVSDGKLTAEEEGFLKKLENALRLPKDLVEKISSEVRTSFMQNYVVKIIEDQRLSPDEERELETIASNLNIKVEFEQQTKRQLDQLKLYWALENLDLPIIEPDIHLQKMEQCFMMVPNVTWNELRSVRQRTTYDGYSTSFRVAKGFYLRSGSYQSKTHSIDKMTQIDRGTLYLTNKRILFTGEKKNSNIRLEKVLGITPYSDGVEIDKETGKSPVLQFNDRVDIFCVILERLLRNH